MMDFGWVWTLIYVFMILMIAMLIFNMISRFVSKIDFRREKDPRIDNRTINREVFKELSATARQNRIKRIRKVIIKPSKFELTRELGRYAGHVPDKRFLILKIKTSHIPWKKAMLLFVPYALLDSESKRILKNNIIMPLTVKNIELYIEGIMKYGWWWLAIPRRDSELTQESVEAMMAEWMSAHMMNRYLIIELPPETVKAPTRAAASTEFEERHIVLKSPPSYGEEEKEVPE